MFCLLKAVRHRDRLTVKLLMESDGRPANEELSDKVVHEPTPFRTAFLKRINGVK
jgi:hypothetical protein